MRRSCASAGMTGRRRAQGSQEAFRAVQSRGASRGRRCEDAVSGVQAAKAGGMSALGVARLGDGLLLRGAGADLVVDTLDAVSLPALAEGRLVHREDVLQR